MAIPAGLRCEWDGLRKATRGNRFWWAPRLVISVGLLQAPLQSLLKRDDWWAVPAVLALLGGAILLWWPASRLFQSERTRIEQKGSGSPWMRIRGAVPMILMCVAYVLAVSPQGSLPATVIPLVIFGSLVFGFEQALSAKGASFDLLDAREQALRAKLAPHFIFNTLNTLHAQIEQDPRAAQATTERLAQLFRQVISVSDRPSIPLKQELEFVEAYLGIEQARLGGRLKVSIEVPEDLESAEIPPLSLQVLVENAIKHGVAPLEAGGEVRIGAERQDGFLRVWVVDPGTGVSPQKGTGTALETLRQRLECPEDLEMGLTGDRHRVSFRWRQA